MALLVSSAGIPALVTSVFGSGEMTHEFDGKKYEEASAHQKEWGEQLISKRSSYKKQNGMKKIDYRNQALKILPWVCANCGRDFSGKNLRELTVHHKDHNYKNNPPDGSNWELLCLYCHDHEHSRDLDAEWLPTHNSDKDKRTTASHAPFADLDKLLSDKKRNELK